MTSVQIITLAVFVINTLLLALYHRGATSTVRGYLIPLFLWSLHTALFYTGLAYQQTFGVPFPLLHYLGLDYQGWSAAVRLHGGLTVLFVLVGIAASGQLSKWRSRK
jgi:hypothetical protein